MSVMGRNYSALACHAAGGDWSQDVMGPVPYALPEMMTRLFHGKFLALGLILGLAACGDVAPPHPDMTDIKGIMPALHFSMTRANDGMAVNGDAYRGKVSVLYFGFTHCPDICPTTLSNLGHALEALGDDAQDVRVLFVTVDPDRDTLALMKDYALAFGAQVHGLRGTPNQIVSLARRYRVAYGVNPSNAEGEYEVTHSNSVFFFDQKGRARYVTMNTDDEAGLLKTLRYLVVTGNQ